MSRQLPSKLPPGHYRLRRVADSDSDDEPVHEESKQDKHAAVTATEVADAFARPDDGADALPAELLDIIGGYSEAKRGDDILKALVKERRVLEKQYKAAYDRWAKIWIRQWRNPPWQILEKENSELREYRAKIRQLDNRIYDAEKNWSDKKPGASAPGTSGGGSDVPVSRAMTSTSSHFDSNAYLRAALAAERAEAPRQAAALEEAVLESRDRELIHPESVWDQRYAQVSNAYAAATSAALSRPDDAADVLPAELVGLVNAYSGLKSREQLLGELKHKRRDVEEELDKAKKRLAEQLDAGDWPLDVRSWKEEHDPTIQQYKKQLQQLDHRIYDAEKNWSDKKPGASASSSSSSRDTRGLLDFLFPDRRSKAAASSSSSSSSSSGLDLRAGDSVIGADGKAHWDERPWYEQNPYMFIPLFVHDVRDFDADDLLQIRRLYNDIDPKSPAKVLDSKECIDTLVAASGFSRDIRGRRAVEGLLTYNYNRFPVRVYVAEAPVAHRDTLSFDEWDRIPWVALENSFNWVELPLANGGEFSWLAAYAGDLVFHRLKSAFNRDAYLRAKYSSRDKWEHALRDKLRKHAKVSVDPRQVERIVAKRVHPDFVFQWEQEPYVPQAMAPLTPTEVALNNVGSLDRLLDFWDATLLKQRYFDDVVRLFVVFDDELLADLSWKDGIDESREFEKFYHEQAAEDEQSTTAQAEKRLRPSAAAAEAASKRAEQRSKFVDVLRERGIRDRVYSFLAPSLNWPIHTVTEKPPAVELVSLETPTFYHASNVPPDSKADVAWRYERIDGIIDRESGEFPSRFTEEGLASLANRLYLAKVDYDEASKEHPGSAEPLKAFSQKLRRLEERFVRLGLLSIEDLVSSPSSYSAKQRVKTREVKAPDDNASMDVVPYRADAGSSAEMLSSSSSAAAPGTSGPSDVPVDGSGSSVQRELVRVLSKAVVSVGSSSIRTMEQVRQLRAWLSQMQLV
jgi:flagellar biosynthesis chaperone FliJ